MCVLAIDILKHRGTAGEKHFKQLLLTVAVLIVVIYFQLLRGDRDALGLILALSSLFLFSHMSKSNEQMGTTSRIPHISKKHLVIVVVALGLTYLVFQTVGVWRSSAASGQSFADAMGDFLQSQRLFSGTWTGVLLTPLSVVGDLEFGLKDLRLGQTYLDLLLSLPPGPIARLFGYTRPFESTRGLAFEMRYTLGGIHITAMPLLNFSAPGVLVHLALVGFFLGRVERNAQSDLKWPLLLHSAILLNSWGWFWYGNTYGIRSIMVAYVAWWGYKALLAWDARLLSRVVAPDRPYWSKPSADGRDVLI